MKPTPAKPRALDKEVLLYSLKPGKGLGIFYLGQSLGQLTFFDSLPSSPLVLSDRLAYEFEAWGLTLLVTKKALLVREIQAWKTCLWNGINLIGASESDLQAVGLQPSSRSLEEILLHSPPKWAEVEQLSFDELGLELYLHKGKVAEALLHKPYTNS